MTRAVCTHPGCITCRVILVGLLAQQLATAPAAERAQLCADALALAKAPEVRTVEAEQVAEMIG